MTDQLRVPDNEVPNPNAALSVRGLSKFFGSRYGDQRTSARGAIRALACVRARAERPRRAKRRLVAADATERPERTIDALIDTRHSG